MTAGNSLVQRALVQRALLGCLSIAWVGACGSSGSADDAAGGSGTVAGSSGARSSMKQRAASAEGRAERARLEHRAPGEDGGLLSP